MENNIPSSTPAPAMGSPIEQNVPPPSSETPKPRFKYLRLLIIIHSVVAIIAILFFALNAYIRFQELRTDRGVNKVVTSVSPTPPPAGESTANWKTFESAEISLKYPPEYSHFVCAGDELTPEIIGIDIAEKVQNKTVDCGIEAEIPGIVINLLGENGSPEEYLNETPLSDNETLTPVQYRKIGDHNVGIITRQNTRENLIETFYAFTDPKSGKFYTADLYKPDFEMNFLRILVTIKFKDQLVQADNWRTARSTVCSTRITEFQYPPNWISSDITLYPEGQGGNSRITFNAGAHGGPDPQGIKNYPGGNATYYYNTEDGLTGGYVTFSNNNCYYIFEFAGISGNLAPTFEKVLSTFKFTN